MGRAFDQVSSGFYQLGAILDEIEETLRQIDALIQKKPKSDEHRRLRESVDQVGEGLGQVYEPSPNRAAFDKDFGAWDEKRLKAIVAANDARFELREVGDLIELLRDEKAGTPEALDELERITGLMIDDLAEAIETFGGKVESIEGQ